jgi:menaquinone-dependent protoporphyrinogen oxidase
MDKILVTYASRTHTTKGIAEAIGNKLIKDSFQVEMLPMANVKDLTGYCAVVAGSAIQSAQWLRKLCTSLSNIRRLYKSCLWRCFRFV